MANILDNAENVSIFTENGWYRSVTHHCGRIKESSGGVVGWQLNPLAEKQHASLLLTVMAPPNFVTPPSIKRFGKCNLTMIVNFMWPPDWSTGYPDNWLNIMSRCGFEGFQKRLVFEMVD